MVRSLFSLAELTEYWHGTLWALMRNQKLYKRKLKHDVDEFFIFSCSRALIRNATLRHQLTEMELYVSTKKRPSIVNILLCHPRVQDLYMMMARQWSFRMRPSLCNIRLVMQKSAVRLALVHKPHLRVIDV